MSPNTKENLKEAYRLLFNSFGSQNWWPGDSPFETAVGAILTQNTNWRNVEKAINNLKSNTEFTTKALYELSDEKLAELIKPAGYFKVKTKRLKNFLKFLIENYNGCIENLKEENLDSIRQKLLNINGIGRETADSIILYSLEKPLFVVDAYTYRILSRHALIDNDSSYDEIQSIFMDNLAEDVKLYNEFHALIVKLGKDFCKTKPKCEECPLKNWANKPMVEN